MITAVPADTPVTTPPPAGPKVTVATPVEEELHVPPPVASFNVVVEPTDTVVVPVMGEIGFIVTVTLPSLPQQPAADCALK